MENKSWPILKLYSSTILSAPFENIQILMQVQFNAAGNHAPTDKNDTREDDEYEPKFRAAQERKEFLVDSSGYLIQHSPTTYQLSPIKSVSSGISNLVSISSEGLLSLWKGHHLKFCEELLHMTIQPVIEGLGLALLQYDHQVLVLTDSIYSRMIVFLFSHTLTGIILTPIQIYRVGLVCRSLKKKQNNWPKIPWMPSLLYHLLSPLFENMIPVIVDRVFHSQNTLFGYSIELGISVLELIVMMPLETIRNRMACQGIDGVVQQEAVRYTSGWDCLYRVVLFEGVWSLYRGFKSRLGLSTLHVILRGLTLLAEKN